MVEEDPQAVDQVVHQAGAHQVEEEEEACQVVELLPHHRSWSWSWRGRKAGGNPPRIFDGTCSEADTFMNEFNLHRLTNIGADQVDNPMKRVALLLGFIQGENVKDWVKHWTVLALDQYNTGLAPMDKHYWNTVTRAFEQAFQDTGTVERTEERIHHLAFTPGEVDGFIAKFESLANEARYGLNNQSTISLFASKLPYKMMDHIYKVVCPCDFTGWADGARQYHQDNQAVQNIRDIHGDMPRKAPQKKVARFSAADLAKILNVKMPSPHSDAMDTRADRNRLANRNRQTQGRASATTPKDVEQLCKEGRCFTCNKQGHISWNCPDKPASSKPTNQKKKSSKARQTNVDDEHETSDEEDYRSPKNKAWVRKGQTLTEEEKIAIINRAIATQCYGTTCERLLYGYD